MNNQIKSCDQMMHIVVPAKAEYLSLLRMVVAALASQIGFSEDGIADIKVALSEASTNVVRHAYEPICSPEDKVIEINCYEESGGLMIRVEDRGTGIPLPPPASEGLGLGIMSSLMDDVAVETGTTGTTVILQKSASAPRR
ncbi:MAG: ATP-binding protein [Thermoleophilia bacterium]